MLRFKRTSEFLEWLRKLKDRDAKAKIEAHLDYCELKGSLLGDTKPVGDSIYEMRFHFGPGYRIYYARSGSEIYLLLIGGDKRKQQADIKKPRNYSGNTPNRRRKNDKEIPRLRHQRIP